MGALEAVNTADLEAEIARRKETKDSPPAPLANPDFSKLLGTVISGVERMAADGYQDEDLRAYIYEAAIEAVYGNAFFTWRRRQPW